MSTADALTSPAAAPAATGGPLSIEQVMGQALVERGLATREQVDGALAGRPGTEATTAASAPPSESPLAGAMADAFKAPSSPATYLFDTPHGSTPDPALDVQLRTSFHEAGIDQGLAADIYGRVSRAKASPKTRAEIDAMVPHTTYALRQAWGDQWQANLATTTAFVREVFAAQPHMWKLFDGSGLGNDPDLIRQLYTRAIARKGL